MAQEEALSEELRSLIEERLEFLAADQLDANADYTAQFEALEQALQRPINLNKVDADELRQLNLMSEIQIAALIEHRVKNGALLEFEELLSIPAFDVSTIRLIRPFCTLKQNQNYPDPSFSILMSEGKSTFFLRHSKIIEEQKGYKQYGSYLGSSDKLYSRYRFQYNNRLSIGFSAEKDAGEEFFKGSQPAGFDFYSAHIFLQDWQGFDKLAIGDFQAQYGQGLTYWSGLAFSGGMGVAGLKRVGSGLTPYTSVQENSFLRGLGLERSFGNMNISVFGSRLMLDGKIEEGTDGIRISGFPGNGLHRTESELERKQQILEYQIGSHLKYSTLRTEIGVTAAARQLEYNPSINTQLYRLENQDQQFQLNTGLDYTFYLSNLLFFGESAMSKNGGFASLNGLLWAGSQGFQMGLLHRHYEGDYLVIQSNALGSNSGNFNERGLYLNLESPIYSNLKLILNFNLYRFPWLRYQVDAPSGGFDRLAELRYRPKRSLELYFRYRERKRERNSSLSTDGVDPIMTEIGRNYRLHLRYEINDELRWQSRIEWRNYHFEAESENGLLIYQDLSYKSLNSPISFSLRGALFDCPTYDSRIYAYERDVLYAFSIPAYNGVGFRYYILLQWKVKKGIDLWIRYENTTYTDRDVIGSGRDEILGNTRSQIKSQLRLRF